MKLIHCALGLLLALGTARAGAGPSTVLAETRPEVPLAETFGKKLTITIDKSKVDLDRHRLTIHVNRPTKRVEYKVYDDIGAVLAEEVKEQEGKAMTGDVELSWKAGSDTKVGKIEVTAFDLEDNWVAVALVPWSLSIPHEEVNFETARHDIRDSEGPKLTQSLEVIRTALETYKDLGRIQLFIAGHTDTVGKPAYNLELSRRRAQAIARWFVDNGVGVPVAYFGFGESKLLVATPDNTDEPRNRRVDYILSVELPSNVGWSYLK